MIVFSSGAQSARTAAGTTNNPLIFWRNRGAGDPANTDVSVSDFPASNLLTSTTYDFARAGWDTNSRAVFQRTTTVQRNAPALAIAAHNFHTLPGNVAITAIRYRQGQIAAGQQMAVSGPYGAEPIVVVFDGVRSDDRWEFQLTTDDTSVQPQAAIMFIGDVLTVPQRIYQGYASPFTANRVELQSNVSEGSQLLGSRVIRRGATATAEILHLEPSYVRSDSTNGWQRFQQHFNEGRGFFWSWRPEDYPNEVHYAWRDGSELLPVNSGPAQYTSVSMSMRFHES